MSTVVSKIQSVVDKTIDTLVNGYVREWEQLLSSKANHIIIPTSIIQICVLYCSLLEEFTIFGDEMECINDGQTAKMRSGDKWNSAFGKMEVYYTENMIYEWKFNISRRGSCCAIGIISTKQLDSLVNDFCWKARSNGDIVVTIDYYYGYHTSGWALYNGKQERRDDMMNQTDITMTLDWNQKTLKLSVDDNPEKQIKYSNIDPSKVYNLAVCISGQYDITLKEFQLLS